MSSSGLAAVLIASLLLLPACKSKQEPGPRHLYTVLRFENLTGNPGFDWVGRAASEYLSHSVQGALDGPVIPQSTLGGLQGAQGTRPVGVPGISADWSAALSAGANRIITGTVSLPNGKLRIAAIEEDAETHKTLRTPSATGPDAVNALDHLAHEFSASARPFPVKSAEALRLYAQASEAPLANAVPLLSRAVTLEPGFGTAWISLIAANRVMGNRQGAEAALQPASKAVLTPLEKASLTLETALLQNDPKLRFAALSRLAENSPGDILTQRSIAQQLSAGGETRAAAAVWKLIVNYHPEDVSSWNEMAYSLAFSGDKAGALDAIAHYAKLRPEDVNALDSAADIHYLFGEFKEAAKGYLAAASKQPGFLNGGDYYKAAFATFKAGDQAAADALFEKFRSAREQAKDTDTLPLYSASWLFRTNRRPQALAALEKSISTAGDNLKSIYAAQLAVWLVSEGQRERASKLMTSLGPIRNAAAAMSLLLSRPSQPETAWNALADRIFPQPQAAALHDTALAYALVLDHHKAAALPVWQRAMTRNTAYDPVGFVFLALLEGKPAPYQLIPDPVQYNQFIAVVDSLATPVSR